MTQQELLQHIEQCDTKSRANPRKVVKVSSGCYYLTVDDHLWHIIYDSEINRWYSYTNDDKSLETDETRTKRQQIDCLLS